MITIRVKDNIDRFISKNINNNISMYNVKRSDDILICTIDKDDLDKIRKLNYYSKIKVVKVLGIKGFIRHLKRYYFDYLLLIFFLILIFIQSNIIVDVEIKHESVVIKEQVDEILKSKDIKALTIKKDINTLNKISDEIMFENKDSIEWISINNEGMRYVVAVEERIKKEEIKEDKYCHIVATHNGTITKIINNKGINMYEKGSTVYPGEIIVSGIIMLNEDIKDNICADALVYGEVWYKINVSYPFYYETKEYTDNSRYNFIFNGNYFYKKNYKHYDEKVIRKIGGFKIVKQREYLIKGREYTYEEARSNALDEAKKKILKKIEGEKRIIEEKVLKEKKNNSTIELELFISVEQLISKRINYEVGEISDTG